MKPFLTCLLLIFVVTCPSVRADDSTPPGYHLVWSDDFKNQPNGPPDPKKWIYEEGFLRNSEEQYYTKNRLENARIENGLLVIEGRRETYVPPPGSPKSDDPIRYTSASIQTLGKAEWTYGWIKVKAKLPAGKGVWPAIWTLGVNEWLVSWPKCGEIDIMELIGRQPGVIHGTLHYDLPGSGERGSFKTNQLHLDDSSTAFHVYSAKWTPTYIDLYVDDRRYVHFPVKLATVDRQNPFRKPHFLLLNLALGGDWTGKIDPSILPQRMSVAWARVYQRDVPYPPEQSSPAPNSIAVKASPLVPVNER